MTACKYRENYHYYKPEFEAVWAQYLNIRFDKPAREKFEEERKQIIHDTMQVGAYIIHTLLVPQLIHLVPSPIERMGAPISEADSAGES